MIMKIMFATQAWEGYNIYIYIHTYAYMIYIYIYVMLIIIIIITSITMIRLVFVRGYHRTRARSCERAALSGPGKPLYYKIL